MPEDPPFAAWTAVALAADVRAGRLDAGAPALEAQARIARGNGGINAVVDHDPQLADPQVAALRARLRAGARPALAGVPVLVKDHIAVAGWRRTQGSRVFAATVSEADDIAVARLRAAGAILIGRSNMSEFGCKGVTDNLLYGPTRHPADPALTPGGSSGGAAAALGAGFVPLALGSDGGGSARRPAAHAGVVGFKPSSGAIPHPRELSATGVLGPMARTVADAALLFEVLRGRDPRDPLSVDLPGAPAPAARPRVAFSPRLGLDVPVDDDVAACVAAAADRIGAVCARLETADPGWPDGAGEDALMPIQRAGLAGVFGDLWRRDPAVFDPDIAVQIEAGLGMRATDLAAALRMSAAVARAAAAFFVRGFDFLIGPTAPCVAWPHGLLGPERIGGRAVGPRGHAVFTPLFNHALCPAISIPAGRGCGGLPVGVQIVGPRFSDLALLAFAQRCETALAGGRHQPNS